MVFLLLWGRQGPVDVAPFSLKDAAKVRTIPDMAKRIFTLPKWHTEIQRHKPYGLPHCHENVRILQTMIGGQSRLKGPFFSHEHAQCGTCTKKAHARCMGFPILVAFHPLYYGSGAVSFIQNTSVLSADKIAPIYEALCETALAAENTISLSVLLSIAITTSGSLE